jgi:glycosyltransferase involved in cell wall biosynthesis
MDRSILASIIVNNYNYGRFLSDAIDSALGQTYPTIEVIVVDDGSTDQSREIIRDYGDRIIPILKENGGQASALNAGFARSNGDIIIFLDSDDILLPDTVGQVVEMFGAGSTTAKVMYRAEVIDAAGVQTGVVKPPDYLPLHSGDLRRYILACPDDLTWMPTSGNAFAAHVLRQIFPMPEKDFRILADLYLSHLTPLFGRVARLDHIGAYYRVHGLNNHEITSPTINLEQIRRSITHLERSHIYIKKFAHQLKLIESEQTNITSVSYIANRIVSLKLEPALHPFKGDTMSKLVLLGVIASLRRFDVSLPMKFVFGLWFILLCIVPKSLARWLAEGFFFPERRGKLHRVISMLQRRGAVLQHTESTIVY